jgi:hypothetical protein
VSGAACARLAALRDWPIRRIERELSLTGAQRLSLDELVDTSMQAADGLDCPADTALTPLGRLDALGAKGFACTGGECRTKGAQGC